MEKPYKRPGKQAPFFALLWLVTYIVCLLAIRKLSPDPSIGIFLSVLPVVTFALFIYTLIKSIAAMDEVQIRVQMEAAVIAFSISLLLIMTLGLLDLVVSLNKEDWGYRHLVPFFIVFYFVGLLISKRKYSLDEKHD